MLNMRQCRCLADTFSRADLQTGNGQMAMQGTRKTLRTPNERAQRVDRQFSRP
jgi:hypothetical protein